MDADPWSVLGVDSSATYEEVRTAYRRRARLLHPDRHREADADLREEAERAMGALNQAWETIKLLFDERVAQGTYGEQAPPGASGGANRPQEDRSDAGDGLDTPEECLDWAIGALIEGGQLQGDPLSSSEVTRATRPIGKEVGRSSFDVWLAQRTATLRVALDTDTGTNGVTPTTWTHCYKTLDTSECEKVIMLMLDELLSDE